MDTILYLTGAKARDLKRKGRTWLMYKSQVYVIKVKQSPKDRLIARYKAKIKALQKEKK